MEGPADRRRHSVRSGASITALRVQLSLLPPVLDECAIGRAAKVFTGGRRIARRVTIDSLIQLSVMQRVRTSNPVRSVRLRHGTLSLKSTFGCRLTVSQLPLKQWYVGSTPITRARKFDSHSGVATVGSRIWL